MRGRGDQELRRDLLFKRRVYLLGVEMTDLTMRGAADHLQALLTAERPHIVYFVHAHAVNFAVRDTTYRSVLNSADLVFGDGVGVQCAALIRGVRMRSNLNGTDVVPALFSAAAEREYRYFLLGADGETIKRAAHRAKANFPGWTLAGYHHGYIDSEANGPILEYINTCRPNLLLVGMGSPTQERWLAQYHYQLNVPLSIAVGGLFDYWGGNIVRAPLWVRRAKSEWLYILVQQHRKLRRYTIGNSLFIYRSIAWIARDLREGGRYK